MSSSEYTRRLQNRIVYADYLAQQKKITGGCLPAAQLSSGAGSDRPSGVRTMILQGEFQTTDAEKTVITNNVIPCPIDRGIRLRVAVITDTSPTETASAIQSRMQALGFYNATATGLLLTNTFTGSTLSVNTYEAVVFATNSASGAAALSRNLARFVDQGGHLISMTFVWNVPPGGDVNFDYTTTPFAASGVQASYDGNMTVDVPHPITKDVGTALTGGVSLFSNGNVTLQSGATKLASYTTNGFPLVAIATRSRARLVGINIGLYNARLYQNLINLIANACLWARGLLV
jgi:hypothetical protein